MGLAYLFRLRLVSLRVVHDVSWGLLIFSVVVYYISYFWNFGYICMGVIIDILCRGVLYFLLLGFRLYSVLDLPIVLRL